MQNHRRNLRSITQQQAFIQIQNTCPLCASELEIKIKEQEAPYRLVEEAHCPQCEVPARIKEHSLH